MRPERKVTSPRFSPIRGEFAVRWAWVSSSAFSVSQASATALPAEAAVQEPPDRGA